MDIFEALQSGKIQDAIALLDQTPSLASAKDKNGVSLLVLAMYYRQPEFVEHICAIRVKQREPLDIFEAVMTGDSARVAELAKNRPLLSSYAADGWTPLHLAAAFADRNIVETLL